MSKNRAKTKETEFKRGEKENTGSGDTEFPYQDKPETKPTCNS